MSKEEMETVTADPELDALLSEMAEEVPPMPADFHDKWMSAVREDAANKAPVKEETPDRTGTIVRWTRILSVAAVFVFLIGGTLLYRSSKKTLSSAVMMTESRKTDAAENAALTAGAIMGAAEEEAMDAAAAGEAMEAAVMAESMEAAEEEAAWEAPDAEEAEAVYDSFLPAAGGAAVNSEPALFAAYEAAASVKGADDTAERKASAAEKAPATEVPVPAATAAPTAAPTEVPTAGPTEVPAEAETGSFFADMGDFLSETWPYLLILAVPAVTASFLRRRKK